MDSILKGLSIESKNSHNGILTKELCKLQAMKKVNKLLAHTAATAAATVLNHFRMYYKLNLVSSYIWVDLRLKGLSDEEVVVVRIWRTKPKNPVRRTSRGLRFSVILGHNVSSSSIKLYMGGLYTQRDFHRVQEFQ